MANSSLILSPQNIGDQLFETLIKKIAAYHPASDFSLIERAYSIARDAHEGQLRKSGEPYIIHPLEVAITLADPLRVDRETIAAGILHDIIEDTDYTYEDISGMFGEEVADLVNGVTKLRNLQKREELSADSHQKVKTRRESVEETQAENYRKLFLAMSDDIRVIMIKIADRLHNLRTLSHMPPEKQIRIAQESLDIYAPLAGRLGIAALRREIEDLSFKYADNEEYVWLKDQVGLKLDERMQHVDEIKAKISGILEELKIFGRVEGRPKHFFSIHKKMINSGRDLDQIYDLFAVRVIVPDIKDCWVTLGHIHEIYKPIQGRFKNYISVPKSNLYQSLHDTLMGPGGQPFEIQIRTWEMHHTAEFGIAAHWRYKEGKKGEEASDQSQGNEKLTWLAQILEWQRETSDNHEYLEALKDDLNVYNESIYCFTPKGQVIELIKGSIPIDFAYAIHSEVGNKMIGAKVDGKIEPKDYVLKNGDRVEILTNKSARPNVEWLKIVKTNQAKSKIKQWLRKHDREENRAKGKELLESAAKRKGTALSVMLAAIPEKSVLTRFGQKDLDSLYAAIGQGAFREGQVINFIHDEYLGSLPEEEINYQDIIDEINEIGASLIRTAKHGGIGDILLDGVDNPAIRYSRCCGPVPGDDVIGFVTRGRGVSVHRRDCPNIVNITEAESVRLIDVFWNEDIDKSKGASFHVDLSIICQDRMDLIVPISQVFTKGGIEVTGITARSVNNSAVFNVSINVVGAEQLAGITDRLKHVQGVYEVTRLSS